MYEQLNLPFGPLPLSDFDREFLAECAIATEGIDLAVGEDEDRCRHCGRRIGLASVRNKMIWYHTEGTFHREAGAYPMRCESPGGTALFDTHAEPEPKFSTTVTMLQLAEMLRESFKRLTPEKQAEIRKAILRDLYHGEKADSE